MLYRKLKTLALQLGAATPSLILLACLSTRIFAQGACGNTPNFSLGQTYDVGIRSHATVMGNFNGDANPDLAVIELGVKLVYIMLGDGAGGFTYNTLPVQESPQFVAVGDFNGDNKSDLAVSCAATTPYFNDSTTLIYLGNGTGGFALAFDFSTETFASSLAVADFNGDGHADLAFEDSGGTGVLSLRLGDGKGGFGPINSRLVLGGGAPSLIIARDLNGDGRPDIVANDLNINHVLVLLNNGSGGFNAPTRFSTGASFGRGTSAVLARDLNGDGKIDLAVSNRDSNVSILLGDGAGGFGAPNSFPTGLKLSGISSGDFNSDGKLDLVASSDGTDGYKQVVVLLGDGLGGFINATGFDVGKAPVSVLAEDFNRDNLPDILTTSNGVPGLTVLLNNCAAGPTILPSISVNDITVAEGNTGVAYAGVLSVTLSAPSTQRVAVSYTMAGGTSVPPYMGSGVLFFEPGQTVWNLYAPVPPNIYDENDQVFTLDLSYPVGATIARGHATCTILDDDPPPTVTFVGAPQSFEGNSGTTNISFAVKVTGVSRKPLKVDYATADGTAVAGEDYLSTSGTLTLSGESIQLVSVPIKGDTIKEPNETFFLNLSNPLNVTIQQAQATATITNDDMPTVSLGQATYTVAEDAGFLNVNVFRTGETSSAFTVKYVTSDTTDANFNCNPATTGQLTGVASRKCDYHIAVGTLRFAAGEVNKQITLSIVDDTYVEGTESFTLNLTNPAGTLLGQSTATVRITDNDTAAGAANPINNTSFYVRQLYVDLLSREPDPAGWSGWTTRIDQCGQPGQPPPPCDRVTVGGDGFLRSGEFFDRQFFVLRLYRTGLGRILRYDEVADLAYVSGFLTAEQLELNKQDLVAEIMSRQEFRSRYDAITDPLSYVATLEQTAGVTVSNEAQLIRDLGNGAKTRAQVFREISESAEVSNRYLREAQVVSAYYGFFTRNPDAAYEVFLDRLTRGEITLADLANAFINAQEYRQRFGQ